MLCSSVLLLVLASCSGPLPANGRYANLVPAHDSGRSRIYPVSANSGPQGLLRTVGLRQDMVAAGTQGRKVVRRMTPRYITIHATENYSPGADANRHALALKRGALRGHKRPGGNRTGYLIWHFTVDDTRVVQHMPTTEQGEHADFDGPGNNYSIGIEMCENRGSHLPTTIDRTARLTAYLMRQNNIPLSNVVPHYHWARRGLPVPHKPCPHFFMTGGRPNSQWYAFKRLVQQYYQDATAPYMVSN